MQAADHIRTPFCIFREVPQREALQRLDLIDVGPERRRVRARRSASRAGVLRDTDRSSCVAASASEPDDPSVATSRRGVVSSYVLEDEASDAGRPGRRLVQDRGDGAANRDPAVRQPRVTAGGAPRCRGGRAHACGSSSKASSWSSSSVSSSVPTLVTYHNTWLREPPILHNSARRRRVRPARKRRTWDRLLTLLLRVGVARQPARTA